MGCGPWGREESDTTEPLPFHSHALEKAVATHSSVLDWRIPGTGEPGGLLWGRIESDTTEAPPQPQGTFLVSQRWGGNRSCWGVVGEARGPVPCGMVQSQSRQGWR